MTYHPLSKETGSDDRRRAQEAQQLVSDLMDAVQAMKQHEASFVEQLAERCEKYGDGTFVSAKQLFWLRDLRDRYL